MSALDIQIGGNHYKILGAYQPWEVLARCMTPDELRGFAKGTAIAYLMRERQKGGLSDISKAAHTLRLYEELREVCEEMHAKLQAGDAPNTEPVNLVEAEGYKLSYDEWAELFHHGLQIAGVFHTQNSIDPIWLRTQYAAGRTPAATIGMVDQYLAAKGEATAPIHV